MQISVKSSIYILGTVPEIVGPLHTQEVNENSEINQKF